MVAAKTSISLGSFVAAGIILSFVFSSNNSLGRTLGEVWTASGDFCQRQWDRLLDAVGEDDLTHRFYGTLIVATTTYWIVGIVFLTLDFTTVLSRYKTQPGSNEPIDKQKLYKALQVVVFNQTVVAIPFHYCFYLVSTWSGSSPIRELPSLLSIFITFAFSIIVEEIGFYYSHRLFHNRHIYKYIHKKHHEWTAPIAVVAVYCHPVEHVIANLIPLAAGPTILGAHIFNTYLITAVFIFGTMSHHSGYHLPFLPSPEFHDFHHLKFTQCYGLIGVLDRWHNTDALFRSSGVSDRHVLLTSLTPMRDLVPLTNADESK